MTRLALVLAATCVALAPPAVRADASAPAHAAAEEAAARVLVPADATWRLLEGRAAFPPDWRDLDFDDSSWREAPAGIGYGDEDDATVLDDMAGHYVSIAVRHAFRVSDLGRAAWVELRVDHDDGFVAWLDGVEVARSRLDGDPPAFDALARDHEAGRWSVFEVPREMLTPGRHVLAVEVHNSDLHSSDLSFRAELRAQALEVPEEPRMHEDELPRVAALPAPTEGRRRWTTDHALQLGASRISNYFQSRAGTPKEEVGSGVLGYELTLGREATSGAWTTVRLHVESERFDGLGTTKVLAPSVQRRTAAGRLDLDARLKLDRPAFRLNGQVAQSDTLLLSAGWTGTPSPLAEWQVEATWLSETNDLDPARENEQLEVGAAVRFLPASRRLSPELGVDRGNLRARDGAFDYDQWRWHLSLVSKPGRTTYLSLLLRWTDRDYATGDPTAGNYKRHDERELARALVAWRPTRRYGVVGWASWESGTSSRPNRDFESWTAWAGLALHF